MAFFSISFLWLFLFILIRFNICSSLWINDECHAGCNYWSAREWRDFLPWRSFLFDLYFLGGFRFPNVPPVCDSRYPIWLTSCSCDFLFQVYFHNHCGSSKLNPNLKMCGFLCLNLLNTWSGNKNECWVRRVSTIFLQVIVSIQSLVLTAKPYLMVLPPKRPSGEACCQLVFYLCVINPWFI